MSDTSNITSLGESKNVSLTSLLLDDENPRLPPSQQGIDQSSLAVVLEMGFDAFTVAESIAHHGYFTSEPLIVIPASEAGKYVVVEGNRRLTALIGLTQKSIRSEFATPERWDELAATNSVDPNALIPVVVAPSREACTPVIGFRHISGILSWNTFAQARYVASLVDRQGLKYDEVARLIGVKKQDVASLYREQAIADQARSLGIDTGALDHSFSLLQLAMGNPKLREFVGAPQGLKFEVGSKPIPEDKVGELAELIGYIFGNGEREPAISDSRQISQLGNVIAEPKGLDALRAGETLAAAKQKIDDSVVDPIVRLRRRLETAKSSLAAASEDLPQFSQNEEILELLQDVSEALRDLESSIE